MNIAIGSDHGGVELKKRIRNHLEKNGHAVIDLGCDTGEPVDYPDFAVAVARRVQSGKSDMGIMVDGAGIGSTIAANKISGIRAALCNDLYCARNAREHNDANMLVMGANVVGTGKALQIVDEFLTAEFQGGRHQRRIDKINDLENPGGSNEFPGSPDLRRIIGDVLTALARTPDRPGPETADRSPGIEIPRVVTEEILRKIRKSGMTEIFIPGGAVVTPLARDYARDHKIRLRTDRTE
ncbi:ribose 5-phosphate isomerase B [bacterium]|nr:ribose 5-phosphate isomerase B [candidate division CSSED10-310 bacterium]